MVEIISIGKNSIARRVGIKQGDKLISVNGNAITDVLDYRFYITDSHLSVRVERDGGVKEFDINKPQYDDIGLEFETYLMDRKKTCRNKCVFCFIDQNPHGMRETIYFKDDDERLSFLQGNYVTLTNLGDREIERIIKMRISPMNISVHTVNPDLRCTMTGNRFAGDSLKYLKRLSDAGIEMNLQFVLCHGINDGPELTASLEYIRTLESVVSAAFVPAGLTGHREGLPKLTPFDCFGAGAVIDAVEHYNAFFRQTKGEGIVFLSDEFYLLAGRQLPPDEYYDGYMQLENGVGMLTNLITEFDFALEDTDSARGKIVSVATGEAAYPTICELAKKFTKRFPQVEIFVYPVKNKFFGGSVTVSGLLTGQDIIKQLKGKPLGEAVLIPCNMLKTDEDIFLDDTTLDRLESELGVRALVVGREGSLLCDAFSK